MATCDDAANVTDCDKKALNQFLNDLQAIMKKIKDYNAYFSEFLDRQKKLSKELWNGTTTYNILNAGPSCVYPMFQKEELLQELLVKIQDKSTLIFQALNEVKLKYESLSQLKKTLEREALSLNWNPSTNPSIKASIKHLSPSLYLEGIADVLFQFDILISCMFQYFDALDLHNSKSYENLMNSFIVSTDVVELVKEFTINSATLLN